MFLFAVLLAGAVAAGVAFFVLHGVSLGKQSLRRGVDFLLSQELGARYRIEAESLHAGGSDPSGEWWVALESDPADLLAKLRAHKNLRDASWSAGSGLVSDRAGVHYFRGALSLGDGSICPAGHTECGVEVRLEEGDRRVYLNFWKP